MTDNEIVKALGFCAIEGGCDIDCPGRKFGCEIEKYALDLINRQKAEIERLQTTLDDVLNRQPVLVERTEKYARAEVTKEFAERLKTYPIDCNLPLLGLETKQEIEAYFNSVMKQIDNAIDNLVKEMTEETKHD